MSNQTTSQAGERTQQEEKWFHVFAFPSLEYICDVRAVSADEAYDPRINGDGNVIWQEA